MSETTPSDDPWPRMVRLTGHAGPQSAPRLAAGWRTNWCAIIECKCGNEAHYDGNNLQYVRCAKCGRTFAVAMHVAMTELDTEEAMSFDAWGHPVVVLGEDGVAAIAPRNN